MASLKNVVAHLIKNYPDKRDLSKARVTKMVYLADWRSSILFQRQITDIVWYYDHYGPYVQDVHRLAAADSDFRITQLTNVYGSPKERIELRNEQFAPSLTQDELTIVDYVIQSTSPKTWNDFLKLVYSTYPIRTQPRYSLLNLVGLARDYLLETESMKKPQATAQ